MHLTDRVSLGDVRITGDGYLVTDARIARTGIQIYAGREVGRPDLDRVRVYRPEAEVFARDALASLAHRPVTLDHPDEAVTAKNWRRHSVGITGDEVARDGTFVRVPMVLMDAAAISAVQDGKRELSCGYTCDLKFDAGKTPEGEAYDAVQTNIRANHLAIVSAGRAGSDCRIGDDADEEQGMTLQKVTVDGITVEMSDTAAQVVSKVQKQLADATAALAKANTDHAAAIAAKDGDLAKKDAEIDALKGKVLDAAALDAAVRARGDLVAKAKAIAPGVVTDGKSDAEIRHAVVAAKIGDAAIKDKPAAYIDARFDILAEGVKPADPVRDALRSGPAPAAQTTDAAYTSMVTGLQDAWKGQQKGAA
ncbi:hypothetical protein RHODGE_RHODGE_01018 [Rhodoplanes serenus]|uniref:DUF2213 domain-containing protein n=1 Tax=Rhodoplanes serenus TaxID=200615 RepID=A0A3S5CY09_9BRAD|nr:DUF2213 domain-containing protein [Rhodoplanes serenus]VCU06590.1 hypothetical protein RHODPL_RHODPL_00038 [Rhodoplanes serenus]VCU07868.1 hypothetical protein RHODGE_RHODGE_01018 [Rhodoplanes serenus]